MSDEQRLIHKEHPNYCIFEKHYKGTLDRIEGHVSALREKVFNGLSDLPGEIRWIKRTLIGMLVAALLALGSSVWTGVQNRAQADKPSIISEATILEAVIRDAVIRQAIILEAARAAAEAAEAETKP